MALFPFGNRHFRLIVSNPLGDPKRGTEPTLDELLAVYDDRAEIPARFRDLTWSSWFRINSRMVESLQHGRFFLGGDSAHIHSPAGAQGMNTGIQDMINLCWKLALVVRGQASPDLIATYSTDRLPVIRSVLSDTENLARAIGAENHWFRALFNHITPLVVGTEFAQNKGAQTMSQVALGYRHSPLSATHTHSGSLRGGDRLPDLIATVARDDQPPTTERLLGLLDPSRFTLLVANAADNATWQASIPLQVIPWAALVPIVRIDPTGVPADRERFVAECGPHPALILVRPDSYVGFVGGETALPELLAYLRRWLPVG